MASTNMLTMAIYLDPTPGGVAPELHLKEGASSVQADLYILDASSFIDAKQKDCVIRGIRPDGSELFRRLYTGVFDTRLQIRMTVIWGQPKNTLRVISQPVLDNSY